MSAPDQPLRPAWHLWSLALVLAATVAFVYLRVAQLPFISLDDGDYVSDNPQVKAGLTWAGVKWAFTTNHACNWHPLTWISHMVDTTLFGQGPLGPHSINLALHVANAVLLLLLLQRLTGSLWRSACVAALFALHPLRVESVAWVSERKDVLSAFFFLLTLYSYFNYTTRTRQRAVWYAGALALFTLGLLSKPMLVTLPFVLLLLDVWPLGHTEFLKPHLRDKIPFFVLSAASCFATYYAQQQGGAIRAFASLTIWQRLENACIACAQYVRLTFNPVDLAIYYPHPGHWPLVTLLLALAFLATVSALALCYAVAKPFIAVGWFWFIGMLIPVIGLVQVGSQSMADRYTYLPSIGLLILLVWSISPLIQYKWFKIAAPLIFAGAVLSLSILTRTQLRHWCNSETLFRHTLSVTRANFVAHYNLGSTLLQLGRLDEAIDQFEKTLTLYPRYAEAHVDLGNALLLKQRPQDALAHYQEAIKLQPRLSNAHYNLGTTLLQLGRLDEAIDALALAAKLQPESALPALNLGTAYFEKNDLPRAIEYFQQAIALQPDLADAHSNLGNLFLQQGRSGEAIPHLQKSLAANPFDIDNGNTLALAFLQQHQIPKAIARFEASLKLQPDNLPALASLAWILSTCPDSSLRNGPRAITLAEHAIKLDSSENPRLLHNLAAAQAEIGKFADATTTAQKALAQASQTGDNSLADTLRGHLAAYEAGIPLRDESLTNPH